MPFLSNLTQRYATKRFDINKKVSADGLEKILEAIQMTPTAYGLQPYHFYIVTNPELKDKIQGAAYGQVQVGTSSHLIVFAARKDAVDLKSEYLDLLSHGDLQAREKLKGFDERLTGFIRARGEKELLDHAARQTYIALGFALAACAELEIDSCPMEGFDSEAVRNILEIPASQEVVLMLPIGYRDQADTPRPKVRFPQDRLFTMMR